MEMRRLRVGNVVVPGWALVPAIEVDGNGRVLGLSEKVSWVTTGGWLGLGAGLSTLLLVRDKRYRVIRVMLSAFYVLMVAPKFIG